MCESAQCHAGGEFHHIRAEIVCVKPKAKKKSRELCVYEESKHSKDGQIEV